MSAEKKRIFYSKGLSEIDENIVLYPTVFTCFSWNFYLQENETEPKSAEKKPVTKAKKTPPKPNLTPKTNKSGTKPKKTPVKTDTDEESEVNDKVPQTLTFITPKRTARTPILKKSPGEEAFVQLTPKLNALLERGTVSDKRRRKAGKTPGKTPAEILDIDNVGLSSEE